MSVKKEVTMRMKICVILSACLLTATRTWIVAKRRYEKKNDLTPPPINKWKIALLTIGAIWVIKMMMTGFRWIQKKLKILEQIQNSPFHIPPMDSESYCPEAKRAKLGFNRSSQAARQRARSMMGIE